MAHHKAVSQTAKYIQKNYGLPLTTAPAAADTIVRYLTDSGSDVSDFDAIITGDLGEVGSKALYELLQKEGLVIRRVHKDCGMMIFDRTHQDVHAGGSGCGCCASVLCSDIFNAMSRGALRNILFVATGALLSVTTAGQKRTIPSIAHLIRFQHFAG